MLTVLYTVKVQKNESLLLLRLLAAEWHLDQMLRFLLRASAAAPGAKRRTSFGLHKVNKKNLFQDNFFSHML